MTAVPFVPELRLWIADSISALWEQESREGPPPYWGFPWLGGQALARFVLDRPEVVRDLCVLDLGTGSGLVAIAAARAGARRVLATDIDPRAVEATRANAALNAVEVEARCVDLLVDLLTEAAVDVDVILAGDVAYERPLAERVFPFLRAHVRAGGTALIGDPGRAYFPSDGVERLARYEVPTAADLEGRSVRAAGVFRVRG